MTAVADDDEPSARDGLDVAGHAGRHIPENGMTVHAVQGRPTQRVRTLFVSDVHLGCRHAQTDAFLSFLSAYQPDTLYIAGDFIDGWKLRRKWRWPAEATRVIRRLIDLSFRGTRICYTPGNHDAFLREFLYDLGIIEIADEFIAETADGRRLLVTHGDRFDRIETGARWMSVDASIAYDTLLSVDRAISWLRHRGRGRKYTLGAAVKRSVKRVVRHISAFEERLVAHAERNFCQGIVCGHIHTPTITRCEDITYCNTGDWVENCTALIEDFDGALRIVEWAPDGARTLFEEPGVRRRIKTRNRPVISAAGISP